MPLSRHTHFALLIVALVLIACGCESQKFEPVVQDLEIAPEFTWKKVETDAIGVMAVTAFGDDFDWSYYAPGGEIRDSLRSDSVVTRAQMLATHIAMGNPRWRVVDTVQMADSVGWKIYSKLIDSYANQGQLSAAEVQLLDLGLRGFVRYVVLVRISSNATKKWEEEVTLDDGSEYIEYGASRTMTIDSEIYDLWIGELVWSGWAEKTMDIAEHGPSNRIDYDKSILDNVVGAIVRTITRPKVEPPPEEEVLHPLFTDLAGGIFPPVPLLYKGAPGHALVCSLCPDLIGQFDFRGEITSLYLDGDDIRVLWANRESKKLKKNMDGEPATLRCVHCGSEYTSDSEWMKLAPAAKRG
jgi:hypothetical protein